MHAFLYIKSGLDSAPVQEALQLLRRLHGVKYGFFNFLPAFLANGVCVSDSLNFSPTESPDELVVKRPSQVIIVAMACDSKGQY